MLGQIISLIIIGLIILVCLIVVFYIIGVYNRLVSLRNAWEATFNQVLVTLKKRMDMITQLVDSVRSYAKFEKDLFTEVTKLRSYAMSASNPQDVNKIEREIRSFIGDIRVAVEAYPDPKTAELVSGLMAQISSVEDDAARYRYTYNNIVQEFNTICDVFPSNIIASIFGFRKTEYLEIEKEVERRPETSIY